MDYTHQIPAGWTVTEVQASVYGTPVWQVRDSEGRYRGRMWAAPQRAGEIHFQAHTGDKTYPARSFDEAMICLVGVAPVLRRQDARVVEAVSVMTGDPFSGGVPPDTGDRIMKARCGDIVRFVTRTPAAQFFDDLTVNHRSWGRLPEGLDQETARRWTEDHDAVRVTLTGDGKGAIMEWHRPEVDGPDCAMEDQVRYERWQADGRAGHGYVHPDSRRIVQTG